MSMLFRLVICELRYRPWTAALTVSITASAVVAVLFFVGLSETLAKRTRIIQRDMGLNVRFIPEGNRPDRYWLRGYAEGSIDQALVDGLSNQDVANRLVPMLQRAIPIGEGEAILTGIGEERFANGRAMKPVFGGIATGETVVLGSAAAEMARVTEGDAIAILGREFRVARVLAAEGSSDDLRVHAELPIVQSLLGMPGKLNEIRALECGCDESVTDPEERLREVFGALLPGTIMIRHDRMADTRRRQRQLADRVAKTATPLAVAFATVIVSALLILNTRQRRREIGLLTAVGRDRRFVAALIGCRSVILGVIAGLGGVVTAWAILAWGGPHFSGADMPPPDWSGSWLALGLTLGVAIPAVASLLPIAFASRVDAAVTLREE